MLTLLLLLLWYRRGWVLLDSSRRGSRTAWSQVCGRFDMHRLNGTTCVSVVVVVGVVVLNMVVTVAEAPCRLQCRVPMGLIRCLQHGPALC